MVRKFLKVLSLCVVFTCLVYSKARAVWEDLATRCLYSDESKVVLLKVPENFAGKFYLDDTVQVIEENAFENCSRITDIRLNDALQTIGKGAFKSCCGISSIYIPKCVKTIDDEAFSSCSNLTDVCFASDKDSMRISDCAFDMSKVFSGKTRLRFNVGSSSEHGIEIGKMLGERTKKQVAGKTDIASQDLLSRGGYTKKVGDGLYSLYMPCERIVANIEKIIREEMNAIGGQEVKLPVAMPADMWVKSGRYFSVGKELLRFKDRKDSDMVLGMTHEEPAVHLADNVAKSYTDFPFMVYQFQTKFRDESRARGGLIRVREFTMKDAYSFHISESDLSAYYDICHKAYERIFRRVGLPEVVSVKSDSGVMGGKIAHEFMLLTEIGEDSIAICSNCDYKANVEAAPCIWANCAMQGSDTKTISIIKDDRIHSMTDLFHVLSEDKSNLIVPFIFQDSNGKLIVTFLRADVEVNETKVRNVVKSDVYPLTTISDSDMLHVSPLKLKSGDSLTIGETTFSDVHVILDKSLQCKQGMNCSSGDEGEFVGHINTETDLPEKTFSDIAKISSKCLCPSCNSQAISVHRGIEVANIFQLGDKYTKAMGMHYTDSDGKSKTPVMGCYGIGIQRLVASICQAKRDANGPIWPISVAPWKAHICVLNPSKDQAISEIGNRLYEELISKNIDTIFDNRGLSFGQMMADADLIGAPIRVLITPKNLSKGNVELRSRDKSVSMVVPIKLAIPEIEKLYESFYRELH